MEAMPVNRNTVAPPAAINRPVIAAPSAKPASFTRPPSPIAAAERCAGTALDNNAIAEVVSIPEPNPKLADEAASPIAVGTTSGTPIANICTTRLQKKIVAEFA